MTRQTITAEFTNGLVATRTTAAPYMFASRRVTGTQAGRGATVRFHTTEEAARDAAGARGEVVRTNYRPDAPAGPCVVCRGERYVEYGPSATDGTMDRVPCHRCNAADDGEKDQDYVVDVTVFDAEGEAMDFEVPVTNDNEGSARAVAVRVTAQRLGVPMTAVHVNRVTTR